MISTAISPLHLQTKTPDFVEINRTSNSRTASTELVISETQSHDDNVLAQNEMKL